MSDLISRSALIKEIEGMYLSISGIRSGKGILLKMMEAYKKYILDVINEQPTAYDVDKVVEELRKESYQEFCDSPRIVDLKDVIDIVKRGGVE